ncbi:hypothetical protein V3C99_000134 [Haemonchus contortus]
MTSLPDQEPQAKELLPQLKKLLKNMICPMVMNEKFRRKRRKREEAHSG